MIRTLIVRLLQRSPALRFFVLPAAFLLLVSLASLVAFVASRRPRLDSINPEIGSPGEVLVIRGARFGREQGDGWVEVAGSRVTASSYIQWTDRCVMLTLPELVGDGLVYVHARSGTSNPLVFANRWNIPVAARKDSDAGMPAITSTDVPSAAIGSRLTLYGKNFGITRNASTVFFTWQVEPGIPISVGSDAESQLVACQDHDFDYEFWSDQEIRVRVPDGACTGSVYVRTERGLSSPFPFEIANSPGTKRFANKRTYVISTQIDITGISASEGNMLFLRVPMPPETPSQRGVQVTASDPKPYMDNYRGIILHQLEGLRNGRVEKVTHSFLVNSHSVLTSIKPALVKPYADVKSPLYAAYTAADPIVPSGSDEIALAAAQAVGTEKNPYLKARLIYDYLTRDFMTRGTRPPDSDPLDALRKRTGDAYDLAILFTAMARASGIPTVPVAGILAITGQTARLHWWAEFYIEGFGWVPVDPSLGAGLEGEEEVADRRDWYFGNLDGRHIAFSRGWVEHKPMAPKSRVVYKPRSYAFQSIWEEAGGNLKAYTSYWGDPVVTGVY